MDFHQFLLTEFVPRLLSNNEEDLLELKEIVRNESFFYINIFGLLIQRGYKKFRELIDKMLKMGFEINTYHIDCFRRHSTSFHFLYFLSICEEFSVKYPVFDFKDTYLGATSNRVINKIVLAFVAKHGFQFHSMGGECKVVLDSYKVIMLFMANLSKSLIPRELIQMLKFYLI